MKLEVKANSGFEANPIANSKMKVTSCTAEIPTQGGWRGGSDEIPKGGWRGGADEIPAGGWRSRIKTDVYRTEDGAAFFEFGFEQIGNIVEIDILDMPSYGSRDDGLHSTHRLPSDRGCYKICFGDPTISSDMYAAKKWAKQWSEQTWDYIRTGKAFPNV
jgi:hypothetical protein